MKLVSAAFTGGSIKRFWIITGVVLALLSTLATANTSALSGSQFTAGNIIDDSIFFNSRSMDAGQVQGFLNSKVPVCDTQGTKRHSSGKTRAQYGAENGNPAPYICMRDYKQTTPSMPAESGLCTAYGGSGVKSAAQIITDIASVCGVNPQTLLVLLQKEQSLVTDDWPWQKQYTKATGFACPDTAPCDPSFGGFFYQVYNAARQFKKYARDSHQYGYRSGRTSDVLFNPIRSCGASPVYIQNQATSGLYIYTPYQPNKPALDNLYGSGDGCSAYGNRNFWRMFSDWFGSTQGTLIRTTTSNDLFYTDGKYKYIIPSMDVVAQYGLGSSDVRFVSQSAIDQTPLAPAPFSNTLGTIVKSEDDADEDGGAIYLISNGYRIPIRTTEQLEDFNVGASPVYYLPLDTIYRIPLSLTPLSNFVKSPDNAVYKIEDGRKRTIFELSKLAAANPNGDITNLSSFTLKSFNYGEALIDNDFVIFGPDGGVRYYSDSSTYLGLDSMGPYECWNLRSIKSFRVSSYSMVNGSTQSKLTCYGKMTDDNRVYLGASNKRYELPQAVTSFVLPRVLIERLPPAPLTPVIKSSLLSELSVIEGGKTRGIPTLQIYSAFGYTASDTTTLPHSSYISLPRGAKALSVGTTILEPNGAVSVVTSASGRMQVVSVSQHEHYGFKWNSLVRVNSQDIAAYPSQGDLPFYVNDGSEAYLIDGKVYYRIPSSLDSNLALNRQSLASLNRLVITQNKLPWTITKFIKSSSDAAIYMLEDGKKRPLASWEVFVRESGNKPDDITILTSEAVSRFTTGAVVR